jgi:hypothetical protein
VQHVVGYRAEEEITNFSAFMASDNKERKFFVVGDRAHNIARISVLQT